MTNLNADDWNNRYLTNDTPWDLSGPTPEFARILSSGQLPRKGRLLVPGGGRGHDAILFAKSGYEVDLVDFAPAALEAALIQAAQQKATVNAFRQNFFELPHLPYHRSYDVLLEYTFFCAIEPSLRAQYAAVAASVLRPGGWLLGLFFPLSSDKPGPPFVVSRKEIEELFSPQFELKFEEPHESVKPRAGREILALFRRK